MASNQVWVCDSTYLIEVDANGNLHDVTEYVLEAYQRTAVGDERGCTPCTLSCLKLNAWAMRTHKNTKFRPVSCRIPYDTR